MTDENASAEPRTASAPPRVPEPEQLGTSRSRTDPMSVPATAPVWTYQHSFEPSADRDATDAAWESLDATDAARMPVEVEAEAEAPRRPDRRGPALGVAALLLAVAAAGVETAGIGVSIASDYATGSVLAIVAIAASVGAVVVGIVATILRAGRAVGIVGAVLGAVVNPLVLVTVLGAIAEAASID